MLRLALNLLVLNGEVVLPRCLRSVAGAIDELVVVDSGSTDRTREVVTELARELKVDRFHFEQLDTASDDFFTDAPESWKRSMPGPFTGRRVLKDWAKARNLALANTTADYVLKLDADDELRSPPENLRKACVHLDAVPDKHKHFLFTPYEIYEAGKLTFLSMQSRLWRRGPHTRWVQPIHEYLRGMVDECCLQVAQGICVRDWKDSPGEGVRIAHRNLKVLVWHCDNQSPAWPGHDDEIWTFTLATEVVPVFPAWGRELLTSLLDRPSLPSSSMPADCYYHLGCAYEVEGNDEMAMASYLAADRVGSKHLLALLAAIELHRRAGSRDSLECQKLVDKVLSIAGSMPGDPLPFNVNLQPLIVLRDEFSRKSREVVP